MVPPRLFVLSILVAGACHAASQAGVEGLVEVRSRYLDQVELRPQVDFAAYRKVLIEPAPVNVRSEANINERLASRLSPEHAKAIAGEAASAVQRALAEAFKARGYEIADASGPGVLQLSPKVAELVVNAPDDRTPGTYTFTREAGRATLALEVRDALSGNLLARVAHQGTANQMGRLALADEVTNRTWFEAFFRRWAADCAEVLRSPARD